MTAPFWMIVPNLFLSLIVFLMLISRSFSISPLFCAFASYIHGERAGSSQRSVRHDCNNFSLGIRSLHPPPYGSLQKSVKKAGFSMESGLLERKDATPRLPRFRNKSRFPVPGPFACVSNTGCGSGGCICWNSLGYNEEAPSPWRLPDSISP